MSRVAAVIAALLFLGMFGSFACAIWTGDMRWSQTALVFFIPAVAATVWAGISRISA